MPYPYVLRADPFPGDPNDLLDELVVGKHEFIAGSGMMPGSGFSSTTFGTPKRSTRTSMRHQSRQPRARYASSATRSVSRHSDAATPLGGHWKIASGCSRVSQIHFAS